jgi:nicotinate phosphoribosyltransferase
VIARAGQQLEGRPLLRPMMRDGRRLAAISADLDEVRRHAATEIGRLPDPVRSIEPADPPYPVEVSAALRDYQDEIAREIAS